MELQAKKVFIVDDQPLFANGLETLLSSEMGDGCEVHSISTALAVFERISENSSSCIIFISMDLLQVDSLEVVKGIHARSKNISNVLLSTTKLEHHTLGEVLDLGVSGVIPKTFSAGQFALAIKSLSATGRYFPDHITQPPAFNTGTDKTKNISLLTSRQEEVLKLVEKGLPNKLIAHTLNVKETTIKYHVKNIYGILKTSNRVECVRRVHHLGLLSK